MKRSTPFALLAALAGVSAHATPVRLDGPETNLQQIVNDLTIGGPSSVNVLTDQHGLDEGWRINSIFGAQGQIVVEIAGFASSNRLGIYDVHNPNARVELFSGSNGAGATTRFDIGVDGRVWINDVDTGTVFDSNLFGFYLTTPVGTWFSQLDLNVDGADHLVAYQGQGDTIMGPKGPRTWGDDMFMLAWEDLAASNWDQDYNDFVLFVSGVKGVTVPEPATLGLLGLGLAGFGFSRRRSARAAS